MSKYLLKFNTYSESMRFQMHPMFPCLGFMDSYFEMFLFPIVSVFTSFLTPVFPCSFDHLVSFPGDWLISYSSLLSHYPVYLDPCDCRGSLSGVIPFWLLCMSMYCLVFCPEPEPEPVPGCTLCFCYKLLMCLDSLFLLPSITHYMYTHRWMCVQGEQPSHYCRCTLKTF